VSISDRVGNADVRRTLASLIKKREKRGEKKKKKGRGGRVSGPLSLCHGHDALRQAGPRRCSQRGGGRKKAKKKEKRSLFFVVRVMPAVTFLCLLVRAARKGKKFNLPAPLVKKLTISCLVAVFPNRVEGIGQCQKGGGKKRRKGKRKKGGGSTYLGTSRHSPQHSTFQADVSR